jgi:hypothetical protein
MSQTSQYGVDQYDANRGIVDQSTLPSYKTDKPEQPPPVRSMAITQKLGRMQESKDKTAQLRTRGDSRKEDRRKQHDGNKRNDITEQGETAQLEDKRTWHNWRT